MKNLYQKLPKDFTVKIHKSEDGGFWAEGGRNLKNLMTQGETLKELFMMLREAIEVYFSED